MSYKNIMLIGAGGNLGPAILNGLLDDGTFHVSVLSRKSSKSTFPAHVKVVQIDDEYPFDDLVAAFKGQDAVISNVGGAAIAVQERMVDAAIDAGVKRFLPSEFGSPPEPDDSRKPMVKNKVAMRNYLKSKESTGLTWTGVICSAFFEWGLTNAFMKLDIAKRQQTVADSGDARFATSTWRTVSAATNGVLHNPEATKNRYVYVQSFAVSTNELRAAVEKALGGEKIEVVERIDSATYIAEQEEKVKKGDMGALYNWIWARVVTGGDLSEKLDNDLFKVPKEDLQEVVNQVVKEVQARS